MAGKYKRFPILLTEEERNELESLKTFYGYVDLNPFLRWILNKFKNEHKENHKQ